MVMDLRIYAYVCLVLWPVVMAGDVTADLDSESESEKQTGDSKDGLTIGKKSESTKQAERVSEKLFGNLRHTSGDVEGDAVEQLVDELPEVDTGKRTYRRRVRSAHLKEERARNKRRGKRSNTRTLTLSSDDTLDELCEASLCSWTDKYDEERGRNPYYIKYAECNSAKCDFSFASPRRDTRHRLRSGSVCTTITTDVMVYSGGIKKWVLDVPIACVCARKPTTNVAIATSAARVTNSRISMDVKLPSHSRQHVTSGNGHARVALSNRGNRRHSDSANYARQMRRRESVETWEHLRSRRAQERRN